MLRAHRGRTVTNIVDAALTKFLDGVLVGRVRLVDVERSRLARAQPPALAGVWRCRAETAVVAHSLAGRASSTMPSMCLAAHD